MSMNDNLEAKMAQLTDVIKGMSNTPKISASDLNDVLNNLVQRIEVSSDEKGRRYTSDLQAKLTDILEERNNEIKEKLSAFETIVSSVGRDSSNPTVEEQVRRILNDIEAIHSKMSSSEAQTENLIRAFESLKNQSSNGQIQRILDEVVSVSRAYDGIVEVLNGNFKEFLKQLEALGGNEEFQKVRFAVENIENGQDVLLSTLNSLNQKQDEVGNLVRMSNLSQGAEKIEQMQSVLTKLNDVLTESASKADIELIEDKIASITTMLLEFRKTFDEVSGIDFRNVYQGQLNNIISKLENIKSGGSENSSDDIMRLYSSIAEFKDGLYSTVNQKLNDIISSMEGQFDKITSSMLTTSMDSSEATSSLASEVQKLKTDFETHLNIRTTDIKEEIKKQSTDSVITSVNALKGELSRLSVEIQKSGNKEKYEELIRSIDQLKQNVDMTSVIEGFEQVKAAMSLNPLRDELMRFNKEDLLNSIGEKIDNLLSNKDEIILKLDEINNSSNLENIYKVLDSINQKIDFSTIDTKLSNLKEFLTNADFTGEITSIREKLSLIDNIGQGLVSVKNIDFVLSEIKTKIEDSFRLNSQRINEDAKLQNDIRGALNTIFEAINTIPKTPINVNFDGVEARLNSLSEGMLNISNNLLPNFAKENFNNVEKAATIVVNRFDSVSSKISEMMGDTEVSIKSRIDEVLEKLVNIDMKFTGEDTEKIEEIKEKIELLDELVKNISNNISEERFALIEKKLTNSNEMSNKETREILVELQNNFATNIKAIKTYILQNQNKPSVSEEFIPVFDELEARMSEKFVSVETLIEENQAHYDKKTEEVIAEKLGSIKDEVKALVSPFMNTVKQGVSDIVSDVIRKYKEELMLEVSDSFKGELDSLISFLRESKENSEKELLAKFVSVLASRENSEARVNYVKSVTDALSSILEKTNSTKDSMEGFKNYLNGINEAIQRTEEKIIESVSNKDGEIDMIINSIKEAVQTTMQENDRLRNFDAEALINSLNDIMDGNEKITDRINEEISSNISVLSETARTLETVNSNIGDYISQNNINNEGLSELIRRLENCVNENNSDYINLLNSIKEEISLCDNKTGDMISKTHDEIREAMENLQGSLENIIRQNSFDNSKLEELQESINHAAESRNNTLESSINNSIEETKSDIINAIEQSREDNSLAIERKIETLLSDYKESIINAIRGSGSNTDLAFKLEERLQNNKEQIISLIGGFVSKYDEMSGNLRESLEFRNSDVQSKFETISNNINSNLNETKQKINEVQDKFANAITEIKDSVANLPVKPDDRIKTKMDSIELLLSEKIDSISDRIEGIVLSGNGNNDRVETYTLADVEADIAKIRLSIEKNNKLTNFKEFAARLIELKNINLENSKISRAIGSDIMRFDTWLKNATAKIDMLASKLEKSEKVKFDDLKSKLSGTKEAGANQSKIEDAIMSIYKKYRTQESKIDDIVVKLETMAQAQAENFDMKEFIDLFYDNTKKQETLMSRMDSIEDKMDLIQAKIDHIISSCIDE